MIQASSSAFTTSSAACMDWTRLAVPNTFTFSIDYEMPRTSWAKGTRVGVTGTWNDNYNIANSGGTRVRATGFPALSAD